ncbi:putative enzyme related to lactoylglutathione lyase [Kineococcus xinjiangensis]|uniref:Putative enzyme related to lactoylglutathione lyase n=1 Tax=Kineococcus xinjiangensis TaxID=512762 RepID=A0A2S6IEC4_9ACTN|nr:VOC family protein [Kineococcus xinjiangensis]PPK92575.1 putative enzyme related to lactoylglutathione lyase [Kineococcus xinjiangensis]
MQRVTGVGGVFFKARDPEALAQWYRAHLGVDPAPESYEVSSWWQEAGPTVLAPMGRDSQHFGAGAHSWSLNFRVADLDAMVEQLRRGGVVVEVDPEVYPNGRFASLEDPEGNRLQLWQPDGADRRGSS